MGFTKAELKRFEGKTVPDLVGPNVKLCFVGINPGLWTAATQTHFGYPSNRFYPALYAAGITDHPIDHADGMSQADHDYLVKRGIAITNLVRRATATAAELTTAELRAGGKQLRAFVRHHTPKVVAVLGITAYRSAFGERNATVGRQPDRFEEALLWVLPNPSGLNAHETIASLATAYAEPAAAAGIDLHAPADPDSYARRS